MSPEEERIVRREAEAWIALGRHPHVVEAYFVERIDGRLYTAMALVGPDSTGARSLAGHLQAGPLETRVVLRWNIHIARGMRHANRCGIRAHRDLKPSNILVDRDDVAKVGDWGLGQLSKRSDDGIAGTEGYMAPEQLAGVSAADVRSDIYSLGVLLHELATGLRPAGGTSTLSAPLREIIARCTQPAPTARFSSFAEVEAALASILASEYGESVAVLEPAELLAEDWSNRGMSLYHLERYAEALESFEHASAMDPDSPLYWANQGDAFRGMGRLEEALSRYETACSKGGGRGWYKKGILHGQLGHHAEAIACYRKALRIDRRDVVTLNNLGCQLNTAGKHRDAIRWLTRALDVEPRMSEARFNRGQAFYRLGLHEEAAADFADAGRLSPLRADSFHCRALALWKLGRSEQAMAELEHALELDPMSALAWYERGNMLGSQRRYAEAADSFRRAVRLGGVPEALERLRQAETDSQASASEPGSGAT